MSRIDKRFIKFGTGTNEVNIDVVPDGTTRMALKTRSKQSVASKHSATFLLLRRTQQLIPI